MTAPFHQLTIDAPEEQALAISAALENFAAPAPQSVSSRRMGARAPWRIEAIFDEAPDEGALVRFFDETLDRRASETTPEGSTSSEIRYTLAPLPPQDWLAMSQAALPPIRTRRFYVRQPHIPLPADVGARHVLTIEAGLAFGTGHHASTKGCLLALEVLRAQPACILDLGTGTGLLALAAAKLWPSAKLFASDIDPVAVKVARENCRLNGASRIACITAAGVRSGRPGRPYDLVVATILAKPLQFLPREIAAHTSRGGRVVLSGILDEQAAEVTAHYVRAGFTLFRRRDYEGWATLVLRRA